MRPALRLFRRLLGNPRRAVRLFARPRVTRVGLALWALALFAGAAILAAATLPFGVRFFDCAAMIALAAALSAALLAWASLVTWAVLRPLVAGESRGLSLRGALGLSAALAGWANACTLVLTAVATVPALWSARLLPGLFLPAAFFVGARAVMVGLFAAERLAAPPMRAALAGGLWLVLYAPVVAGALPAHWANRVAQGSMRPTLEPEEIVLVNRLAPRAGALRRWDVVVFRDRAGNGEIYIKRLVGLPGEEITLLPGRVLVNGHAVPLPEGWTRSPYVPAGAAMSPAPGPERGGVRIRCAAGEFFLLGDNSEHSRDGRETGTVARRDLLGRAFLRVPTRAADARPGLAFLRRYGAL